MEYSPSQVLQKMNVVGGGERERVKLERRKQGRPLSKWGREGLRKVRGCHAPGRWSNSSAQMDSAVLAGSIQPMLPQWDGTGRC